MSGYYTGLYYGRKQQSENEVRSTTLKKSGGEMKSGTTSKIKKTKKMWSSNLSYDNNAYCWTEFFVIHPKVKKKIIKNTREYWNLLFFSNQNIVYYIIV